MSRARTIYLPSGERLPLAALRRLVAEQRQPAMEQPALFELRVDARPSGMRTAAERYREPSLFTLLEESQDRTSQGASRTGGHHMTLELRAQIAAALRFHVQWLRERRAANDNEPFS